MNRDAFSDLLKAQVASLPNVPVQLLVEMNLLTCASQLDVAMHEFDFSSMAKATMALMECFADAKTIGSMNFDRARETSRLLDGTSAMNATNAWLKGMARCECANCTEIRGVIAAKVKDVAVQAIAERMARAVGVPS